MEKLKEVREYDKICCNPDFRNEYAYIPKEAFADLVKFIHEYTSYENQADALEFLKIGCRRNVGDIISVTNYVGLIQMKNGYQIQVLPKIDFSSGSDNENRDTKRIFLRMLSSMKDFPSKVFNDANLKTEKMSLYEIFINMYLLEVRTLVKHGIKSTYVSHEDNLHYFKGKLVVNEHLKRNSAHGERFYVSYDEFMVDRAENRIIKATLLKLQKVSYSAENQKEIRQLLIAFEMIKPSINYQKDFSQVVIDRSTKEYSMLMPWSRVFLMNKSFSTFSGSINARALLFPMEKVFESYVAQQLKKALWDLNWSISCQDKGYYLFDTPKQFALRPDIVLTRDDGSIIILDTKWKRLIDNPKKNYGISQADMYQMYAYSKKYDTSEIWLLYPVTYEMKDKATISYSSDDGVKVTVFFVDVANIENSVSALLDILSKS